MSDRDEPTPEQHEIFDRTPPPQDAPPPPPFISPTEPRERRKYGKGCLWAALMAFTLLLGGCTAVFLLASLDPRSSEEEGDSTNKIIETGQSDDADIASDENEDDQAPEDGAEQTPIALDSTGGTLDEPHAFDHLTTIEFDVFGDADGSRWNVVLSPISDSTSAILAENEFANPPPEGVVFAGFDAQLTLVDAGKEPLAVGFNIVWEILGGSTAAVYNRTTIETASFGCGSTPSDFDDFAEAYVGGTIEGLVCIPLPIEDLKHEDTHVALNFGGDRIHFAADGSPGQALRSPSPAKPFPAGGRTGTREEPFAFAKSTPVRFETFGDADQSEWQVEIGPLSDVADVVLRSNQFNEPPPDGAVYAGFQADMTLLAAGKEPLSPGFNYAWEVIGGATARAYGIATLDTAFIGCGVIDGSFDVFAEVFATGMISGLVCIPIPAEDLTHPNTRIAMNFTDGDRIHFGP